MFRNKNVYILNFRKNSSTNQTKRNQRKVLRSVCGPRRAMRGRCTGCDARTSTGWLSVQAAPCTVRGLFAMCCARAGCIRAVRCDAQDAMRGPMRCELVAMQCAARGLVAFARCRRHHAFDGGILRVGFLGSVKRPYVRQSSPGRKLAFARLCKQQKG